MAAAALIHPLSVSREKKEIFFFFFQIAALVQLLQFARASLVAQLVKNPPAMQETPVQFLGREDPLEKG